MDSRLVTGLFDRVVELPLVWKILWLGLAVLSIALLVLMRTRWGQSRPLRKCAVLSLLAHALLACFATTVQIVTGVAGTPEPPTIRVAIVGGNESSSDTTQETRPSKPWDPLALGPVSEPSVGELARSDAAEAMIADRQPKGESTPLPEAITAAAQRRHAAEASRAAVADEAVASAPDASSAAEPIQVPAAQRRPRESILPTPNLERTDVSTPPDIEMRRTREASPTFVESPRRWSVPAESTADNSRQLRARGSGSISSTPAPASVDFRAGDPPSHVLPGAATPPKAVARIVTPNRQLPKIYRNRVVPDRARVVDREGGSKATESAVKSALRWLAAAQDADGSWHAFKHGAGLEKAVLGHDRRAAGSRADTGVTGLAILAMLGAGHTHTAGQYQESVRRGLGYLVQSQGTDGNLSGEATLFAKMYCHGIATFALSEACAMTGDRQLEQSVRKAIAYSLSAQHPTTGGWRYLPWRQQQADPGDTSQLGWQVMALESAKLVGVDVPAETYQRVDRFLQSVASGPRRGLAGYRPRAGASRTMTAEALVCRQLLDGMPGVPRDDRRSGDEAAAYILQELPSGNRPNLYYWYYATLGLYQHQGPSWHRWNEALKGTLVAAQITDGAEAGSWSPDTVWGGYGGRVYSTAMAALCLEVYYRYLPLYEEIARRRERYK